MCYDMPKRWVPMEEKEELERQPYEPRPGWQVWGARIGLALFLLFVIWQLWVVARGGL